MPTSTTVNNLKINKLTKAQYDDIQSPSETELYLVEESIDTTPTNGSDNPISSGAVFTALEGKEDVTQIVAQSTAVSTLTAEVGKYYRFDVAVETLAITLPTMTNVTSVKTITFYMTGGTTPGVTFTSTHNVYLADFTIESGKTYEVNAAWNGASWIVAAVNIVISNS